MNSRTQSNPVEPLSLEGEGHFVQLYRVEVCKLQPVNQVLPTVSVNEVSLEHRFTHLAMDCLQRLSLPPRD